jgi:hypothetical protein
MLGPDLYAVMAAATALTPAAKRLPDRALPDVQIVVFRHHPGIMAEANVMKARDEDAERLLEAAKEHCGGHTYEGGLGSGYELSLGASDLGRWKAAVDKLIKAGALRHYDHWGLDRRGYGLVPVR